MMWKQKSPSLPEPTPPAPPPVLRLGNKERENGIETYQPLFAAHVAQVTIAQGLREQADQIRLTPDSEKTTVEYLKNGKWQETMCVPYQQVPGLFSAFKTFAGLPDCEHRMVLQGLIAVRHEGIDYDVLIFVTPTRQGETILMRIEAVNPPSEQTPE